MDRYFIYKLVHFIGLFLMIMAMSGMIHHAINGGKKELDKLRKQAMISHGVGSFLVLLGGFGMMARLGLTDGLPGWIIAKLAIWTVVSGAVAMIYRAEQLQRALWWGLLALLSLAAYLGIIKPF